MFVSFSVSAQVFEPQHRTRNWFSAWTAFGSSVQAVLPLVFPNRYEDPLLRSKRIQELLVHIAESTSSVSQQQKKEELRTQLSLLEYRLDLEEEEKETVEIMVEPIPVVLLPPMHQLPSSTGTASEGGNPGDPNPASAQTLGATQQPPASNATQELGGLLRQNNYKLKAIENALPPNHGSVILSGIQGYGPQIVYALLATTVSRFIPPTIKTISGLRAVNSNFKTHTEWPVIAYELEKSNTTYPLNTTPWNRPIALGIWVVRVGHWFLMGAQIPGHVDLSFLTQTGHGFLVNVVIRGNLNLSSLTKIRNESLHYARIEGNLNLSSATEAGDRCLKHTQISGDLSLGSLTKVGTEFLGAAQISKDLYLPSLTQAGGEFLFYGIISGNLDSPSLVRVDGGFLWNTTISKDLNLPSLTEWNNDCFLYQTRICGRQNMPHVPAQHCSCCCCF